MGQQKDKNFMNSKGEKKESKQSEIAHRTGHNNDKNFFGRTQMISENVRHSSVQFFFSSSDECYSGNYGLKIPSSLMWPSFSSFTFFSVCFLQLMLLTKIPTFPTRKMMTSFNGQKFHPFLVFRFALVEPHVWWDDTPVMFVANDIILLSMRIHSDFSGRQKRTFRLLFCRLDSLQMRPLTLSDERWNSQYRKMFAGAKSAQCLFLIQPNRLCQFN